MPTLSLHLLLPLLRCCRLALCLLPIAFPPQAEASYTVQRITTEDGLSHSFVMSMLLDSRGFLWFGTADGLDKYDGNITRSYRRQPADSLSLRFNAIDHIIEDRRGRLWIASTPYGLHRMNRRTGVVRRINDSGRYAGGPGSAKITALLCDAPGTIWIGTTSGLYRYADSCDCFEGLPHDPADPRSIANDSITFIDRSADGSIWVGAGKNGVNRFNPSDNTFSRFGFSGAAALKNGTRDLMDQDSATRELAWTCLGVLNTAINYEVKRSYDLQRRRRPGEDFFRRSGIVYEYLKIDSGGRAWVFVDRLHGRHSGLYLVPSADSPAQHDNSAQAPRQLVQGNVHSFQQDKTGIVWVGSEKGVYKLIPVTKEFVNYGHDPDDSTSLSHPRIRSIRLDRSARLWVGTDQGLNRYDSAARTWRRYGHRARQNGSLSNVFNVIFEEEDGTLLFGTNWGVRRYDAAADSLKTVYQVDQRGHLNLVWSFYRDTDERLWIGTNNFGLWIFDRQGRPVERLMHNADDSAGICDNRIWCMTGDSKGRLWLGSHNGLNRRLPGTSRFRQYRHSPGDPTSICGNDIWAIKEDQQGTIWIIAYGSGISRYIDSSDSFESFSSLHGLPSDAIFGVLMDRAGMLWISSNAGLSVFDPQAKQVLRSYNQHDGLPGREFAYKAFFQASDGEMFFGGLNGLTRFYPERIRHNRHAPDVAICGFSIFDSTVFHELQHGDRLTVDHDENFIAFEFAALDFTNPSRNQFAYRLDGVDLNWVSGSERRFASYTNLQPGAYTFRLRASNNDGVWNEEEVAVQLEVLPPFWMTTWFRALIFSAVLGLIAGAYYLRLRALRRRHALERQALESQLQALRAQMNPHFIFNALNSIQGLLLDDAYDSASDSLAHFAKLVRLVLNFSRSASISLDDECQFLQLYLALESMRRKDRLSFRIIVAPELDRAELRLPPMLIQPYVENAVLHGIAPKPGGGCVTVSFQQEGEFLLCSIDDDGIGRIAAGKRRSGLPSWQQPLGSDINRQRLEALHEYSRDVAAVTIHDSLDSKGRACGTRVELRIPLREAEFEADEQNDS